MSNEYTYVEVRFMENSPSYAYRTDGEQVKVNDVVLVPTQKGENYGIVAGVKKCTVSDAPYPLEKTKFIIKVVGRKLRVNTDNIDMRFPLDISVLTQTSADGKKTVVVGEKERKNLREKYSGSKKFRLIESFPISMEGTIIEQNGKIIIPTPNPTEDQHGKPARWMRHRHLFGADEYECTYCHVCYDNRFPICPNCHKRMDGFEI